VGVTATTGSSTAPRLGAVDAAYGLAMPLIGRIRVGEGALLAILASLLWQARAPNAVVQFLCGCLAMTQMYGHNDACDAWADLHNPRKNKRLAGLLANHTSWFRWAQLALAGVTVVASALCNGTQGAIAAAAVMACNAAYSQWFKSMPVVDLVTVGVWGALFASIATLRPAALVGVGLMTATSHVFQTLQDRHADRQAGIHTTAARSLRLSQAIIVGLSATLGLWAGQCGGGAWAVFGVVPGIAALGIRRADWAWLVAKVGFAVVWLACLPKLGS